MTPPNRPLVSSPVTLLVLLAVGAAAPAGAGIHQWTASGPPGAAVYELAVDPSSPATLYMSGRGVWKTTDGGSSWTRLDLGAWAPSVRTVVVSPQNPAIVLAGDWYAGVLRSTDGGATWSDANQGLPDVGVTSLAFDPTSPSTVYVGLSGNGVYRSTDGGATWSPRRTGLTGNVTVTALAVDPNAPQTIYAGTYDGLVRSADGGASWSAVAAGLPAGRSIADITIDPSNPAVVYACTEGSALYRSTDGGVSWSPASTGLPSNLTVEALAIDPENPARLYLASDGNGFFTSTDAGASWTAASTGLQSVTLNTVVAAPTSPVSVYVGSYGQGVYRSSDGAATWHPANGNLDASRASALVIDDRGAPRLWASTMGGVWRSDDAASTWTPLLGGMTYVQVADLARDAVDPDVFYAATWRGLYRTSDGGASWARADDDETARSYEAVATDPAAADRVFAGNWSGLHVSEDAGESWSQPATGPTGQRVLSFAFDPVDPSRVYAGAWQGIFRSTDGGATWSSSLDEESIWSIAVDPVSPATLYVCTYNGVFKSTDSGATWTPASSGLTADYCWALLVDPAAPSTVYQGSGEGVFRSTDGGASWSPFPGLEEYSVRDLALSPDGSTLYAATFDQGVASYSFAAPACSLECSATAPSSTWVGSEVYFQGDAVPYGCAAAPSFEWDFGAGEGRSEVRNPSYWYGSAGSRTWTMTARAEGATCERSGTIEVTARPGSWYVPGVAHAPGSGSTTWRTDLAVVNRGPGPASVTLTFLPYETGPEIQRTVTLPEAGAHEWKDVLVSLFGSGPASSSKGTVRVDSPGRVEVTARTYNQAATGTFGQYLPALPAATAGARAASAGAVLTGPGQIGVIPHLKKSAEFRSNLGAQNLGDSPVDLEIRLYGADGSRLGATLTRTVAVGRYWQQDDVFRAADAGSPEIAYATVEITSPGGAAWFYGSVVDNGTGDPTTMPVLLPRVGDRQVAGIAHTPGVGGTAWRSDLAVVSLAAGTVRIDPAFTGYVGGPVFSATATVPAEGTVEWRDAVVSLFNRDPASSVKGTVRFPDTPDLYVTARTYNLTPAGTFGQYLPVLTAAEGFGNDVVAIIPQLKKGEAFRSNLGVLNLSPFEVTVAIRLFDDAGHQLGGTRDQSVLANEYYQIDDVFLSMSAGSPEVAYATVEVVTEGGRVWAYGSVIDNATGDPTTIPALVP